MAGQLRDIKRRVRAVRNTQQITKAMEMVAAAKLRRAQERVLAARPYARELEETLGRIASTGVDYDHPLAKAREEVEKIGYVIITADRGLCGSYNANVIRKADAQLAGIADTDFEPELISVGRKGRDYFRHRDWDFLAEFTNLGEEIDYAAAKSVADLIVNFYTAGDLDEVYIVYTEFKSALSQHPRTVKLLPIGEPRDPEEEDSGEEVDGTIEAAEGRDAEAGTSLSGELDYIYEPSVEAVLEKLLPTYVTNLVYHALLEAKASEHGARMTAMSAASDNAEEMIKDLTMEMNRARQAGITKEISEIVGGAEALKG